MAVSVFDLFKIGIGPSSSHTVGPMRAARMFVARLAHEGALARTARVKAEMYGSLGATGKGHGSDKAVLLGLAGHEPDTVDIEQVPAILEAIRAQHRVALNGAHEIAFDESADLVMHRRESLPFHANGMRFTAYDAAGAELENRVYYSVGGGFVVSDEVAADGTKQKTIAPDTTVLPHPFHSGDDLLRQCDQPGGFKVKRRAAQLYRDLTVNPEAAMRDPLMVMDWVNLYALAVNEENAAGGRVVTAPTNGAAGIVPAVLHYYTRFVPGANDKGVVDFMLTAAAIGILYKENASISGAEVGCQGEVGVACSMAAAGLAAVMGGTPQQVENAAEIGMEHHLGLTCDPVGGLVQIPCIERNAIASVKAINAARMALRGDGTHHVSLDKVIKTMRETGADMQTKYKETARGGLAVNIVEC